MDKIIADAKLKYKNAVNSLWEQHARGLFKIARAVYYRREEYCVRNGLTKEDLQQECYLAFIDALEHFERDTVDEFAQFLYSTLTYRLISLYNGHRGGRTKIIRVDGKAKRISADPISGSPFSTDEKIQESDKNSRDFGDYIEDWKATEEFAAIERKILATELRRYIKEAIETLPDDERVIVKEIYYGGLTEAQVARLHRLPEEKVHYKNHVALLRLRCNKKVQQCWNRYFKDEAGVR